ncbi:hypothetical protein JRO89_XS09G0084400 [Xanthoceras sorbifolium]|uniref:Tubby C-terminal domain-containing protein n=1 Tax=Xanthoceras sorbifolium TaxID=99658 RepID=A0ABQ8HKU1_9ROSI|nr:hypothetical protein JRO89_XS09G0084400 [Xanthoceras sorbifolium]
MNGFKKPPIPNQSSYNSLYVNPLTDPKHSRCCSEGGDPVTTSFDNKENHNINADKENIAAPKTGPVSSLSDHFSAMKSLSVNGSSCDLLKQRQVSDFKSLSTGRVLKPSSLQFCMQMNEPEKGFGAKVWDASESDHSSSLKIWDYSDSEAAPASSWSTLPNRALLCRPLPLDIGRCTCVIVKEATPQGLDGGPLFALYTNEGQGRQNRKLAVAQHKRRNGKSEFAIAQNTRGIKSNSDDSFIGIVTANLMGSKYHIRDQTSRLSSIDKQSNPLLAIVMFMPTIATWSGSYRSMCVYVPKHHSMLLKSSTQMSSTECKDWEVKKDKAHKLCSRVPHYSNISKQYELDFRDRGRAGLRIQSSVKNFQLTSETTVIQSSLLLNLISSASYAVNLKLFLNGYVAIGYCISALQAKTRDMN